MKNQRQKGTGLSLIDDIAFGMKYGALENRLGRSFVQA